MRRLAPLVAAVALLCAPSAHASVVPVAVNNNVYSPLDATAQPGDQVQWTWQGGVSHTVTSDGGEAFASGVQDSGTYEHFFNTPGSFTYHCQFHPMQGTINVAGITGRVKFDADGSTTPTTADDAMASITVTAYDALAYQQSGPGAAPLDSAVTDSTGRYILDNQSPASGGVALVATVPAGYADPGVVEFDNSDVNGVNVGKDFLVQGTGTVSGTVWNDVNRNGVHDGPESGRSDVQVSLNGKRSTTTASDGTYSFANVKPNSSTLHITAPSGYIASADRVVSLISPNFTATGQDFLVKQALAKIAGVVHDDPNGNQTADAGEGVLGGITIGIDTNGDASADRTTISASDGTYGFDGLTPGQTHRVIITTPSGYENTGPAAIDVPNLQPGANVTGADFFARVIPSVGATQQPPVGTPPEESGPDIDLLGTGNGTAGDDILNGTSGADRILGLAGDDLLLGLNGNDFLDGGEGDDSLDGGSGNDRLIGGRGDDRLTGGPGKDSLKGGDGKDRLVGGSGNDNLDGGKGKDTYQAGPGDDVVNSKDGVAEVINCGKGRDKVKADKKDRTKGCEKVARR